MCRKHAYNEKVDVWAVGVMTYLMLGFEWPFIDPSNSKNKQTRDQNIKAHIMNGEPNYQKDLKNASPEALQFVRACLTKNLNERPSAAGLLESPWISTLLN